MDNLTLDELGKLRAARGTVAQMNYGFANDIDSIFSASYNIDNGATSTITKVRYVYQGQECLRNWNTAGLNSAGQYDLNIFYGATGNYASFLPALGHIFIAAGNKLYKDHGDVQSAVGVAAPNNPTIVAHNAPVLHLDNQDGSGFYTNWTQLVGQAGGSFDNTGADVFWNSDETTMVAQAQTTFGSLFDATNMSGPGTGLPTDEFSVNVLLGAAESLISFHITFILGAATTIGSTGAPIGTDYYDINIGPNSANVPIPYPTIPNSFTEAQLSGALPTGAGTPVNITNIAKAYADARAAAQAANASTIAAAASGFGEFSQWGDSVWTSINNLTRASFTRYGTDSTLDWSKVAQVIITAKYNANGASSGIGTAFCNLEFVGGATGPLTGLYQYILQEANNTGEYIEYGMISAAFPAYFDSLGYATITPATVGPNSNMLLIYRLDPGDGVFLLVQTQTGAYGFTPTVLNDTTLLLTLQTNAIVNPLLNVLNLYSQPVPANVIGMIYFAARIVYLTPTSFVPSMQLNPGLTDARFVYELTGTDTETTLFIVKLNVQTFIVATTKDFYQMTGDFSTVNDGTTDTLNISISSLGISDPAISHVFAEYQGSIFYLSSTGIRSIVNAQTTLLNDSLDLLFRGESRYSIPPFNLQAADQSTVAVVTSGQRVYWSLPHTDGVNRIFVMTIGEVQYTNQTIPRTWRLWTLPVASQNPICMCREEDGTIIFGSFGSGSSNSVYTLEDAASTTLMPIDFRTPYNYARSPNNRKDAMALVLMLNTGGGLATITVRGLTLAGAVEMVTFTVQSAINETTIVDLKALLPPCTAYAIEGTCLTPAFELDWFMLEYESRPALVMRALMLSSNFDSAARKRVGIWPFVADSLGSELTCNVTIDGVPQTAQLFTNNTGVAETFDWLPGLASDIGVDWQIEVISPTYFEHYKFLPPSIIEQFPVPTRRAYLPATNFGKAAPKKLAAIPFTVDPRGATLSILTTIDGAPQLVQTLSGTGIQTAYWYDKQDIEGTDYAVDITGSGLFEFYKFLPPDINQLLPPFKFIDQLGPVDFAYQGLVYGFRLRVIPSTSVIYFNVYDGDVSVYTCEIPVSVGVDQAYIVEFPKGINPAVCRIVLTAAGLFQRYTGEFKVRITGRETEERFIKA